MFNNNLKQPKFVFHYLQQNKQDDVTDEYIDQFERAYLTFKYQRVWCPLKKKQVSLNSFEGLDAFDESDFASIDLPADFNKKVVNFNDRALLIKHARNEGGLRFLGPFLPSDIMQDVAECKRDPISKEMFKSAASFETFITDRKFDELIKLGEGVRKAESSFFTSSTQLTFGVQPPKKPFPAQQSLTSFFNASQSNSIELLKKSKDALKKNTGREHEEGNFGQMMDFEKPCKSPDEDISEEDSGNAKELTDEIEEDEEGIEKMRPFSCITQNVHIRTTISGSKQGSTVRQTFEKFRLEEYKGKSIVTETLDNFRSSYLQTKKHQR